MRKWIAVFIPDRPNVEMFILHNRPWVGYINLACMEKKGLIQVLFKTDQLAGRVA